MLIVIIIVLIIIYFTNKNFECFNNNKNPYSEINNIKEFYKQLMKETNDNYMREILKNKIKNSFMKIEESLPNNYDKYKLNYYYYNELIPILNEEYSEINNDKFNMIMNNVLFHINYSLNPTRYNFNEIISDIKSNFKLLNDLYYDIYITKSYNYESSASQIDIITKRIYDLLIKITSHESLVKANIILILNVSLKKSYQNNDLIEVNSLKTTFTKFIEDMNYNLQKNNNQDNQNDQDIKGIDVKLSASIIEPTTTISYHKDRDIIDKIQHDFNKIYNAFDNINDIYKNYGNINQIRNLNDIIYQSIDRIISYNNKDQNYKNSINTIKNVIITAVLEKELKDSYKTEDDNNIIRTKNKFYDGIIEIKNIIISTFTKKNSYQDKDICLKDIIQAIIGNEYPIQVKKLKGCKNLEFINDNDTIITPKIVISRDDGKSWALATDYLDYKKTGKNNNQYLYTQKIAVGSGNNDNYKWSIL